MENQNGQVVLLVGGVGYGLTVSARTASRLPAVGEQAHLYTRLYVREDIMRLYGFSGVGERAAFDLLTGVPGVGPALCLALLSEMGVGELLQAVMAGDTQRLTRVKGVGRRTAEKLLLELRNRSDELAVCLTPEEQQEAASGAELSGGAAKDAIAGLEALDVPPAQARKAVARAIELLGENASVEELIREGLRHRRG